ncbi:M23 family metallopeptidase [Bacillus alkalicellulosilyticus]|uniref:M23 family metallopeptidase n=1 Tax=Alkalihalobacterium alkalicellulosilyticum TaxID=1912214 RepID=UPI001483390A|nr:M23 family metallopeptidase [Bacillus alkalicellulosilyticus]
MRKNKNKPKWWTVTITTGALSPIKQVKVKTSLLYSMLSIPIFLITSIMLLSFIVTSLTSYTSELNDQIEQKDALIQEREQEIVKVKNEYDELEEEALAVKQSIEQFKVFEERLSELNLEFPSSIEDGGSGGVVLGLESKVDENIPEDIVQIRQQLPELIDSFEQTYERLLDYQEQLRTVPTLFPAATGRISSHYGKRSDPITRWTAFHSGTDIAAPLNTEIFAAADGKVIEAGRNGGYGLAIRIQHGDTYETLYAHLNKIDVEIGDTVKKGDVIGGMGTTGRSTGVHLHYEIKRNGEFVDPYPYMTFHERKE